tara:strand:- start:1312 stop:1497 length:186 start_codon:yes stop_codon:yes gene_type:complete
MEGRPVVITCPHCGKEFKSVNQAKGGRKSKRTISPEDQNKMQDARRSAMDKKAKKKGNKKG